MPGPATPPISYPSRLFSHAHDQAARPTLDPVRVPLMARQRAFESAT